MMSWRRFRVPPRKSYMRAGLQIVADSVHLCIGHAVLLEVLARIFRLHPVLHLRIGKEAVGGGAERAFEEDIEIVFQQELEVPEIIVDAHPPENLADVMELAVGIRQRFRKDQDVFGPVGARPGEGDMIFPISGRVGIGRAVIIPETGPDAAPQEFGAELVQELGPARDGMRDAGDIDGRVFVDVHGNPPCSFILSSCVAICKNP